MEYTSAIYIKRFCSNIFSYMCKKFNKTDIYNIAVHTSQLSIYESYSIYTCQNIRQKSHITRI